MILKKQATRISLFTHKLLVLVATLCCSTSIISEAGSSSAWLLNSNLEREETLASPARIGRQRAPQVFNAYYPSTTNELSEYELFQQQQQQQNSDLFKCVDPTQGLFERFAVQYNRTFTRGGSNLVERQLLFDTTLRRTILLNRIVQNEIRNASNYQRKPKIGNYHFVTPMGEDNFALWYADITDCELGLIKKIVFDIFDLIDKNELEIAYLVAHEKSRLLPLFNEDGFEQLANILLVRLYDRFEEDKKMFQLFQWPLYMKKLAAYAYNRQQVSQPNFNAKLSLITYAYPSYFKDIRYNQQAINRTGDNLIVHHEHEKFNKQLARRISSIQERNRRLAIFRQHWTAINLLNDDKKWNNVKLEPDWQRTQQYQPDLSPVNAKLQQQDDGSDSPAPTSFAPSPNDSRFKQTSFSDLTDAEFVAYLTNDFSLLENNQESAKFLDANFPIRPLTREFRDEIGAELELRKLMQLPKFQQQQQDQSQSLLPAAVMQKRPTYSLARQVVDELIGDVGLPIGPASEDNISEQEHFKVFNEVKNYFDKNYQPQKAAAGGIRGAGLTETDLLDEQQRRYERFKQNYGRFKAWFKKENWNIDNKRLIPMLRLADMSWQDIKLSLFKICCLAQPTLDALSATNSSIRYLVSNDFMCQPLHMDERLDFGLNSNQQPTIGGARPNQQERLQSETKAMRDSVALELYYYYSVHFNKHQSDAETLARRLAIFKHNIDHIRKHSCIRGLSLYTSLRTKNFDSLNTIDVLDPRRSYTDDINLDRFRYFTIPDLSSPTANADESSTEQFVARESNDFTFSSISRADASRAGVSYRREPFFSSVLEQTERQPSYPRPLADSDYTYADRLTVESQDYTKSAQKYRQLAVHKVYDLVMQGYSNCKKALDGIDVDISEVPPRQCVANSLGDQAVNSYLNLDSPYSRRQQLLSLKNDSCGLYWQGLQSWSEGLLRQDVNSPRLIQIARC